MGWHNTPKRHCIIILSGEVELTVGDGTERRLGPGDVLLAEDVTGRGHLTRVIGGKPFTTVNIALT